MGSLIGQEKNSPQATCTRLAVILAPKPVAREALAEHLLELDYRVEHAETLAQAQRLVTRHAPR